MAPKTQYELAEISRISPTREHKKALKDYQSYKASKWPELYDSAINSLDGLKTVIVKGACFVLIDAEPWRGDTEMPAEIGISLLWLSDLDHAVALRQKNREAFRLVSYRDDLGDDLGIGGQRNGAAVVKFNSEYEIENIRVEQTIADLVRVFANKHSDSSEKSPIVLSGFSLMNEMTMLINKWPRLLQNGLFTHWMDIQTVIRPFNSNFDGNGIPTMPNLRETLRAVGHGFTGRPGVQVSQHNAAYDTIIMVVVLICMLQFTGEQTIHVLGSGKKRNHHRRPNQWRKFKDYKDNVLPTLVDTKREERLLKKARVLEGAECLEEMTLVDFFK